MYKQASRLQLRFVTPKGVLSVEQLWGLSLGDLDALAVGYETEYKASGKKSFLAKKSKKDKEVKLRFDIVIDILTTKVGEQETADESASKKAKNQEIMGIIKGKEADALKGKSVEELKAMLD